MSIKVALWVGDKPDNFNSIADWDAYFFDWLSRQQAVKNNLPPLFDPQIDVKGH